VQLARDQAQERGLARAVAAHQPDLMAIGNSGGGLVEQYAAAKAKSQVVDVQHERQFG
jgi:hypothetical protein